MTPDPDYKDRPQGFWLRELFGVFLLFWILLLLLSLVSFSVDDPSLNHAVSKKEISNMGGLIGAYVAGFLNDLFGTGSLILPFMLGVGSLLCLTRRPPLRWWRWVGVALISLAAMVGATSIDLAIGDLHGGGILGSAIVGISRRLFSPFGSLLFWICFFLIGLQLFIDLSWRAIFDAVVQRIAHLESRGAQRGKHAADDEAADAQSPFFIVNEDETSGSQTDGILDRVLNPVSRVVRRLRDVRLARRRHAQDAHEPDGETVLDVTPGRLSRLVPLAEINMPFARVEDCGLPLDRAYAEEYAGMPPAPVLQGDDVAKEARDAASDTTAEDTSCAGPQTRHGRRSNNSGGRLMELLPSRVRSLENEAAAPAPAAAAAAASVSVPHAMDKDSGVPEVMSWDDVLAASDGEAVPDTAAVRRMLGDNDDGMDVFMPDADAQPVPASVQDGEAAVLHREDKRDAAGSTDLHKTLSGKSVAAHDNGIGKTITNHAQGISIDASAGAAAASSVGNILTASESAVLAAGTMGVRSILAGIDDDDSMADSSVLDKDTKKSAAAPQVTTAPAKKAGRVSRPVEGSCTPAAAPAPSLPATQTRPVPSVRHAAPPEPGMEREWVLPPMALLRLPDPVQDEDEEDVEERSQALVGCLNDFGIQAELVRATPGPVVTTYMLRPAPGVPVRAFTRHTEDIARALMAVAVFIQAPVPGTDTVGIVIPNRHRALVNFREIASSQAFMSAGGALPLIVGKDTTGKPFVSDLARMPHLLVAGATGQGKSVCLNAMLTSLLLTRNPDELKLLLVDPKRVEMGMYEDESHLVHPVVKEVDDAKNALLWAVHEMDQRYTHMARLYTKNITGYNQRLASYNGNLPSELADLKPMPYIVIVIDELADLMLQARKEVEPCIIRLAQLARACGIHMIIATQRPSVDVVTGLIKANFPCRICFRVSSKQDSLTTLGSVGAEKLLGNGDMFFNPNGGHLMRLHGPFLRDDEVQSVVEFWKKQSRPVYEVDFSSWEADEEEKGGRQKNHVVDSRDAMYNEVLEFIREKGHVSISLLQRRFNIGYNKAARYMDQLDADGLVGPSPGAGKPRPVLTR